MRNTPDEKKCPFCGEIKKASEFQRNASRPDGLTYTCRVCIPLYAAAPKRPKTDLSVVEKKCSNCERTLNARAFSYNQQSEDKLTDSCRVCRMFRKGKPSIEQVQEFELAMSKIYSESMEIFDHEFDRSQFEAFVYTKMIDEGLLENWKPPVWMHSSSKVK